MKRFIAYSLVLITPLLIAPAGAEPAFLRPGADVVAPLAAAADKEQPGGKDDAVQAKLARKVPEVKFDGVALVDVVDFLRDISGLDIAVDWPALERAGVAKAAPVTLAVKNVPLSQALTDALKSAGGDNKLTYAVKDGAVHVTAK